MSDALAQDDSAARLQAVDPGASVLLEAPAGSGKTAVLTQRFLRLLVTVEDPAQILAITFTRKAAAEMRARVTRALRGQIGMHEPAGAQLRQLAQAAVAHGRARGWNIDAEPQSLRIQTIDSFNYWLASQLPVAARVGGRLNVTEAAAPLYQRAARRTLISAEADPALGADTQLLFERFDNHWINLERMLAQMLRERGHWLRFVIDQDPRELCREVNDSLAAITRARLCAAQALLPQLWRHRAEGLPGMAPLGAEPADLGAWQHLAHLTLARHDWRAQVSVRWLGDAFAEPAACRALKDLIADLRALGGAKETLLELRHWPPPQLAAQDAAAIGALSRLLRQATAELYAEFARAQRVDYTYITGAARAALTEGGAPTELGLRAGLNLRHILVDEFQDTSLAQFQLLEALTAGWEPGDGRTLFVVGDPMQSIYRFRDAEVGLFLAARHAGIGTVALTPLRLRRNFRAHPELVGFANEVFTQVFPAVDDLRAGAVRYSASIAARAPAQQPAGVPAVTLALFPEDRPAEARAIAARVAALRAQDPQAHIAVLVVAHAHAVSIVAALEAAGVAVLGVDLVPLAERVVVRDLVALTRALHDLADRTAWLAVLRAPWCGVSLASLAALSGLNDKELILEALGNRARLARCAPADLARVARLRDTLTAALAQRGTQPVADWLEATWVQLGAPDAYRVGELADAHAFFSALAQRAAAFEWRTPADFTVLLQDLFSAPGATRANPVQVMTIHRAKGLEFDHVLVPALDKATGGAERRLLRWMDLPRESGGSDLLIAPAPAIGAAEEDDLDAYLKELVRRRDANERARLMYVAATRARATLWLSGAPAQDARGAVSPDRRSLLSTLWPALAQRFQSAPAAAAAAAPDPGRSFRRLRPEWRPPAAEPAVPVVNLPPAHLTLEPPEFSWVGETQRHVGTLVHEWLARLALGSALPTAAQIGAEAGAVHARLARLGVSERERAAAAALILSAIERTVTDERGRWLLDSRHAQAHAELALTGVSDGRLRNIVIDRSFIDAEGVRWVIDFKTSRHEGSGLEQFLDEELERYRAQLQTYRGLARALGPEPVRAALYFPLLRAFREL